MASGPLPGKHGDSLDYDMIKTFLTCFAAGIVLGIVLVVAI